MRTPTRTATTTIALTFALVLGGCNGGGGEPTESTSTASGPSSSSTSQDKKLEDSAASAFGEFWDVSQTVSPSETPSEDVRALMTDEAYQRQVEFSKAAPPMEVKGKDKLTATSVKTKWSTAGPTATVEVCYTVHRRLILTEDVQQDGKTLKKGKDVRTDPDGKPIKAGTEMVNLVTMKRGRQDEDQWKVDSTKVGYKPKCTIQGES